VEVNANLAVFAGNSMRYGTMSSWSTTEPKTESMNCLNRRTSTQGWELSEQLPFYREG